MKTASGERKPDPFTSPPLRIVMTPAIPYSTLLTCHPETYSHVVRRFVVSVGWTADALALTYALNGDITRLRIPPARPQRRMNRLWEHTCFEAFISVKGNSAYQEFNFSPSGEWAAYAFRSYRERAPFEDAELAPEISMRSASDTLEVYAIIPLDRLPTIPPRTWLRLGLSAVIEEESGLLTYWALKHPSGKPDFHNPDAFALELGPPDIGGADSAVDKR